jgi:tetratricopeptide (TPR) repeat protein
VFSWSIRALTEAGRRCFWLLGVHPGPDISWPATVSLSGLEPRAARRALAELVTASLLSEQQPGRWAFHDLLRAYAAEQAAAADPGGSLRGQALAAALDHYLHTAYAAALALEPTRTPIPAPLTPPAPGVRPEAIGSRGQAQAWFRAEHQVLIALLTRAAATSHHTHAWQLQWCIEGHLEMQGHWQEWDEANRIALAAATALGDHTVIAHAHQSRARAAYAREQYDEAIGHLNQALSHAAMAGDLARQALAQHGLSLMAGEQGRGEDALAHSLEALDLARKADDRIGEASYLSVAGLFHAQQGNLAQGLADCRAAVELLRELGDAAEISEALVTLGRACVLAGEHAEARICFQQAVSLNQELGYYLAQAAALASLGDTHMATGDTAAAREAWEQALRLHEQLPPHPDAIEIQAKLGQSAS